MKFEQIFKSIPTESILAWITIEIGKFKTIMIELIVKHVMNLKVCIVFVVIHQIEYFQ